MIKISRRPDTSGLLEMTVLIFLKVCYAIWKYHIAQPYNANSFSKLLKNRRDIFSFDKRVHFLYLC